MRLDDWVNSLPDDPAQPLDIRIKLIIGSSPPRTKKNHPVLVRNVTDSVLCKMIQEWERDRPEPPRSMGKEEPISEATIKAFLENRETEFPHPRLFPSPQYQEWHHKAVAEMLPRLVELKPYFPITCAVHCWVQIYRERDTGDKIGYLQGIYDWLQDMGILADDRQVLSDDGSRMHTDPQCPRIELVISPFVREGSMGMFIRPAKEWAENEEPEPESSVVIDGRVPEPDRIPAAEMAEFMEGPLGLGPPYPVGPADEQMDAALANEDLLGGMTPEQRKAWIDGEWDWSSADVEQRGGQRQLRSMPKARQS